MHIRTSGENMRLRKDDSGEHWAIRARSNCTKQVKRRKHKGNRKPQKREGGREEVGPPSICGKEVTVGVFVVGSGGVVDVFVGGIVSIVAFVVVLL